MIHSLYFQFVKYFIMDTRVQSKVGFYFMRVTERVEEAPLFDFISNFVACCKVCARLISSTLLK